MRQFIRHPSAIPIDVQVNEQPSDRSPLRNVSQGGLSFFSKTALGRNSRITLTIPVPAQPFSCEARVVWCRQNDDGFEIGVKFDDESTEYAIRMVEQICHIEQYRRDILAEEGRHLSSQQAAEEWIRYNAAEFPR